MGWAFLFVIAAMLVWLFLESRRTRLAALGLIGFFGLVLMVFFYVLDQPDRRLADAPVGGADVSETAAKRAKIDRSRTVLTPADVAVRSAKLKPGQKVYWGSDGKQHESEDMFSWVLMADVQNLSEKTAIKDLYLRVRLFSCPSFFSTPVYEVVIGELERRCGLIGDRTTGFYGLDVTPGGQQSIRQDIVFDNQPDPRNWRYWAEVTRVDAIVD